VPLEKDLYVGGAGVLGNVISTVWSRASNNATTTRAPGKGSLPGLDTTLRPHGRYRAVDNRSGNVVPTVYIGRFPHCPGMDTFAVSSGQGIHSCNQTRMVTTVRNIEYVGGMWLRHGAVNDREFSLFSKLRRCRNRAEVFPAGSISGAGQRWPRAALR
jgi:hypothetical protein